MAVFRPRASCVYDVVITSPVSRVTELVHQISGAAEEQSSGIAQINQALTHLDRMTQHNAALVEQAEQGATGLATQADNLVATVSLFKLSQAEKQKGLEHKAKPSAAAPALPASAALLPANA